MLKVKKSNRYYPLQKKTILSNKLFVCSGLWDLQYDKICFRKNLPYVGSDGRNLYTSVSQPFKAFKTPDSEIAGKTFNCKFKMLRIYIFSKSTCGPRSSGWDPLLYYLMPLIDFIFNWNNLQLIYRVKLALVYFQVLRF